MLQVFIEEKSIDNLAFYIIFIIFAHDYKSTCCFLIAKYSIKERERQK